MARHLVIPPHICEGDGTYRHSYNTAGVQNSLLLNTDYFRQHAWLWSVQSFWAQLKTPCVCTYCSAYSNTSLQHLMLRAGRILVAGALSTKADALSCNNLELFLQCCSQAAKASKHPKVPIGHAGSSAPTLDLLQLEDNISEYLRKALALSTVQSYQTGHCRHLQFCHLAKLPLSLLSKITLSMFVSYVAKKA